MGRETYLGRMLCLSLSLTPSFCLFLSQSLFSVVLLFSLFIVCFSPTLSLFLTPSISFLVSPLFLCTLYSPFVSFSSLCSECFFLFRSPLTCLEHSLKLQRKKKKRKHMNLKKSCLYTCNRCFFRQFDKANLQKIDFFFNLDDMA